MQDTSGSGRAPPAVALSGVNLSLGRGAARVHILKDLDLHIARGEAIGLVGPSGSGKSTLLMVMAGLERADTGSVIIAGETLGPLSEDALARFRGRNIGIVFQSFHLIPTMTALENVAVPLELAGVDDARERAGIADEPTGNLDETTGGQIIDLLFAGHARRGTTLVLVTHDPALAARCDRIVRLRSGRIEAVPGRPSVSASP